MASKEEALAALEATRAQLRRVAGYRGSYVGFRERKGALTDEVCIVVKVGAKLPGIQVQAEGAVPRTVGGIATDVRGGETHALEAVDEEADPLAEDPRRYRPAPGGCSVGHPAITAGTLGVVLRRDGVLGFITNNHVAANSNGASIGDRTLQPGPHDGGQFPVGRLAEFVTINFGGGGGGGGGGSDFLDCLLGCILGGGDIFTCLISCLTGGSANTAEEKELARGLLVSLKEGRLEPAQRELLAEALRAQAEGDNLVDAAWCEAYDGDENLLSTTILDIGPVTDGLVEADLGLLVKKRGRTTRLRHGQVTGVGAEVDVNYGNGKVARFVNQVVIRNVGSGDFSAGGDSGSAIVTQETNQLVALLFAGGGGDTIGNRFQDVWGAFPGLAVP